MKIAPRQIENFLKSPTPEARAILIYGPNNGLVKERSNILAKTVVQDLNDPFNVCVIEQSTLIEDPTKLDSEANSFSMMGGNRLIKITEASDKTTPYLKQYLENPSKDNLVIIESENLPPKSSLRKLCETSPNAAALPCYEEDIRNISELIREILSKENMQASPDAINFLSINLTKNRQQIRSEIEKLIIYMGESRNITLEDAINCCGNSGTSEIDELINAIASGNPKKVQKDFQNLLEEGVSVIMILRMIQNHFKRLYITKCKIEQGTPQETAIKSLSPPVFFKHKQSFQAQLQKHSTKSLENIIAKLTELEAKTKQTGNPPEILIAQTILGIAIR